MDTQFLNRTKDACQRHKGKVAVGGAGGLSLVLALELFATKSEFNMLRQEVQEEHRDRMTLDNKLDALRMEIAHFHPSVTNTP